LYEHLGGGLAFWISAAKSGHKLLPHLVLVWVKICQRRQRVFFACRPFSSPGASHRHDTCTLRIDAGDLLPCAKFHSLIETCRKDDEFVISGVGSAKTRSAETTVCASADPTSHNGLRNDLFIRPCDASLVC
jgi:hypothetical protein